MEKTKKVNLLEQFTLRNKRFRLIEEAVEILENHPITNVMEVGSSYGDASIWMNKQYGWNVTGIDKDINHVNLAKLKAEESCSNVRFLKQDIMQELDFSYKFDLIVSEASFSLLEDKKKAVKNYHDMLNSKGKVIVNDFFVKEMSDVAAQKKVNIPCFKNMETLHSYDEYFSCLGFNKIHQKDYSGWLAPLALNLKRTCACHTHDIEEILDESLENDAFEVVDKQISFKTFFQSVKVGYVQIIYEKTT